MKKEKHSSDKISEQTLHEILVNIQYSLNHLEDIEADNRAIIVKLVKQNNQIVEFLKQIEIEEVGGDDYWSQDMASQDMLNPTLTEEEKKKMKRFERLKEILDDFMDKRNELKEFEEELQKHKAEITPGTIGES
tara:strand:- start:136 stop:537 length:402 start_codon:yes stop_codon:yes gene_type:complete